MTELFKEILQRDFYQEIFDALNGEITNKYDEYDLTMRANVVHEVLEASLDDI